jgi:hypothetical protein
MTRCNHETDTHTRTHHRTRTRTRPTTQQQLFRQFPNKDELGRVTAEEPERWDDSWEGAWQAVFAPLILGTAEGEGLVDDDQAEHGNDDQR